MNDFWKAVGRLMIMVDDDYDKKDVRAYSNIALPNKQYRKQYYENGWDAYYENVATGIRKVALDKEDMLVLDLKEIKQFFFGGIVPLLFVIGFNIFAVVMCFMRFTS